MKNNTNNTETKHTHERSEFTQGPWKVSIIDAEKIISGGQGIAIMSGHERSTIEREANARLIAAAPELLEALVACNELLTGFLSESKNGLHRAAIEMARAAIAKAEGRA